jgi:hypothetical protein
MINDTPTKETPMNTDERAQELLLEELAQEADQDLRDAHADELGWE